MPRGTSLYDEAARQNRLWTPNAWRGDPRLAGWWDASAGPFTYATGISQWNDISGNGRHATQVTAVNQPTLVQDSWKVAQLRRQAVSCPVFSVFLDGFSGPTYSGAKGLSVQAAISANVTAATRALFSGITGAPELRINASNFLEFLNSFTASLTTGTKFVSAGNHVVGVDAATNLSRVWLNGASEQSATNPAFTQPISCLLVNEGGGSKTDYFHDQVGEIVLSGVLLTSWETAKLVGYLAWKWGTVSALPANHPFSNRPPMIGD